MSGRSKEELPETTATWKQARKGNTAQWDMVILKINTNSKHLAVFYRIIFTNLNHFCSTSHIRI